MRTESSFTLKDTLEKSSETIFLFNSIWKANYLGVGGFGRLNIQISTLVYMYIYDSFTMYLPKSF